MSFNSDVKEELTLVEPVCSHCNRALLAALIRIEGTLFISGQGRYRLEVACDIASVARLVLKLLHEEYGLRTDLTMRRSVLHKTPNYLIEVPTQDKLEDALHDMGVLGRSGLEMGISENLVAKQCCAAAYLRGAFLGSGFVADPRGDFHFEITVESSQMADGLIELMERKGIHGRVMRRRSSQMVYLKSGEAILEFLAYIGAHHQALELESERVLKSVRNEVNRIANAELANQKKAGSAAADQLHAMRVVIDRHGLDNLPPALKEIIKLRVAFPDATLAELGRYASPPLSKSAVYHRMRRIEQMAEER